MKINVSSAAAFATVFIALSTFLFAACGTRQEGANAESADTIQYELAAEDSVEKDAPQQLSDTVVFNDQKFIINIARTPADSMPKVYDTDDIPFLDNMVKVTVHTGGETIVNRTFTKNDFKEAAENVSLSKVVLGGMVFNTINGTGIVFNAQLCPPGSVEGGNNFKIAFNLHGGNMRITTDDTEEDHSSNDDQ